MQTSSKLPPGWEDYSPIGTRIENTPFIAFKVPLKPTTCKRLSNPENSFTIQNLVEREPELGLVIDLTFTHYYDPNFLIQRNVEYKKIFLRGRGEVPRVKDIQQFVDAVNRFRAKSDKLIGVHCTHGINRTGFMICKYMIDELSFEPKEAVDAFEKARGHKIVREVYTNFLLNRSAFHRDANIRDREPKPPKSVENRFHIDKRATHESRRRNRHTFVRQHRTNYQSHRPNPSFISFDGSDYIPRTTLNNYHQFQAPQASSSQNFGQFNGYGSEHRNLYSASTQPPSFYGYQPSVPYPEREHLHGRQNNNVNYGNVYSYNRNLRFQ